MFIVNVAWSIQSIECTHMVPHKAGPFFRKFIFMTFFIIIPMLTGSYFKSVWGFPYIEWVNDILWIYSIIFLAFSTFYTVCNISNACNCTIIVTLIPRRNDRLVSASTACSFQWVWFKRLNNRDSGFSFIFTILPLGPGWFTTTSLTLWAKAELVVVGTIRVAVAPFSLNYVTLSNLTECFLLPLLL